MADVQPFRGFRYDLARVGALSDVIAPPYDVIDPTLQQALYERSPHNVVRLILNQETPRDGANDNRYTRSGQTLRDWIADGIIAQDSARSIYVYHQEYEVEGKRYTRKGFMARVRLEKFGAGRIYPHEETMSGPKADRLKLFHATNMNLSQIFGLYPDEPGEVRRGHRASAADPGDRPPRRRQQAVADCGSARHQLRDESPGAEADLYRGWPSSLRNGAALPGREETSR
jgi:hypothetical protein